MFLKTYALCMDRSLTWLPTNNMDKLKWLDNGFNQSAKWQCAEVTQVDTVPCTGDYMMIGRESLFEFSTNNDDDKANLNAGSFEYMKYKLWSQLAGSDQSACHYAILEVEILNVPFYSPPFPCPVSSDRDSRIIGGQVADYYPFFVATDWNTVNGGTILSPEYVMIFGGITATRVAYGIRPGQNYQEALSGPNVVDVVATYDISSGLTILKVSPPITFGPYAKAARISDCSGPSNPQIGDSLAFYGLGFNSSYQYTENVEVSCGEVIAETSNCVNYDYGFSHPICIYTHACYFDWGGPIMAKGPDGYYLVAVIYHVSYCNFYDFSQPSVCEDYDEIMSIINS